MWLANPWLYAVGDVNGISLLDSTAFSQASVAVGSILGHEGRFDSRWIPRSVHTVPPVATVGWTLCFHPSISLWRGAASAASARDEQLQLKAS